MTKTSKTTKTKAPAKPKPEQAPALGEEPSRAEAAAAAAPAKPAPRQTKIQAVVALLRRHEGARIKDIMTATGWQAHSVRGAMSGAIKKGLGLSITSDKVDGVRIYRIAEAEA